MNIVFEEEKLFCKSHLLPHMEVRWNLVKPDVSNVGVVDKGVEGKGSSVQEVHVLHPPKCLQLIAPSKI